MYQKKYNPIIWMRYNDVLKKIKIVSLISFTFGVFCTELVLPTVLKRLVMGVGNVLIDLGTLGLLFLYIFLAILIYLTKKFFPGFKYMESMRLTRKIQQRIRSFEGNKTKYEIEVYNRKIVPKTFAIVTGNEVICFYYEANSFRLHTIDEENKERIADYVSRLYSGHCNAWQPMKSNKKRYKNYFVNTIKK